MSPRRLYLLSASFRSSPHIWCWYSVCEFAKPIWTKWKRQGWKGSQRAAFKQLWDAQSSLSYHPFVHRRKGHQLYFIPLSGAREGVSHVKRRRIVMDINFGPCLFVVKSLFIVPYNFGPGFWFVWSLSLLLLEVWAPLRQERLYHRTLTWISWPGSCEKATACLLDCESMLTCVSMCDGTLFINEDERKAPTGLDKTMWMQCIYK